MTFYFIKVKHDVTGRYLGFDGWKEGYNGPHGEREARRIMAFVGGVLIPVEIENPEALLDKAKKYESAQELMDKKPTPSYHEMIEEMNNADYDWQTIGGGRKLENVTEAYKQFNALQKEEV